MGVAVTVGCSVADSGYTKIGQGMCINKDGHGFKTTRKYISHEKVSVEEYQSKFA